MREFQGRLLFSAHDLVNFLACPHVTFLDLRNLEQPLKAVEDDPQSSGGISTNCTGKGDRLRLFRQTAHCRNGQS